MPNPNSPTTAVCARCGTERPRSEFWRRDGDSQAKWCIACRREQASFKKRGQAEEHKTVSDIFSKWSDFGERLSSLRERYGSDFAQFAEGQLAILQAIRDDLEAAMGNGLFKSTAAPRWDARIAFIGVDKDCLVVTFRRRRGVEIDGQLELWEAA